MKKCDLLLLVLFILPVFVFLTFGVIYDRVSMRGKKVAIAQFEKIYQVPVKMVLLRNTNAHLIVKDVDKQENSQNDIEFTGYLDCSDVPHFKISGDTLLIEGEVKDFDLELLKMNGVKVDTVNAPNVTYPLVTTITTEQTEINGIEVTKTDTIVKGGF